MRTDGKNLIEEWQNQRSIERTAEYIWHRQQLDEIDIQKTDNLLGLFEGDHTLYNIDILNNGLEHQEPTLTDMTVKAIKMLQKEDNGFFLFVEGGKIDMAHHATQPHKAMEETREFARAIEAARFMTDEADTLIVVSSDHSHAFTYNGYPGSGSGILGVGDKSDIDNLPYETLSYANGPGYSTTYQNGTNIRVDITQQDFKDPQRRASTTVPLASETHAADDVGVYASGPWSHLFTGSYEQNIIPVAMAYAAKIGDFSPEKGGTCAGTMNIISFGMLVVLLFISNLL